MGAPDLRKENCAFHNWKAEEEKMAYESIELLYRTKTFSFQASTNLTILGVK